MDPISKQFGEHLRVIREASGLTQEEVAEGLGLTPAAYQHYEAGRSEPRCTTVPKLAALLGVDPCDFFPESPCGRDLTAQIDARRQSGAPTTVSERFQRAATRLAGTLAELPDSELDWLADVAEVRARRLAGTT